VHCHRCGETHEVSSYAQSTICPGCNTSIQFEDAVVSSNVSRPIDTRGKLIIEETGNLNAPFTVCSEATIFGKISGTLLCEGCVRLHSVGKLTCRVTAKSVIIEKGARIEFVHPVETSLLEVHGEATGKFQVDGKVKIGKGGLLAGRFHARSIVVDGGSLLAESSVDSLLPPES
jgi:cytoskeletal protein CcmA (bactofilin family)